MFCAWFSGCHDQNPTAPRARVRKVSTVLVAAGLLPRWFFVAFCTVFAQDEPVEALTNSVAIPLEELENHLRSFAVPGKHGSVRIRVLVRPEAAHEVSLDVQRRTVTDVAV